MNTTPAQDQQFRQWLHDIAQDEQLSGSTKKRLLDDLTKTRTVLVVDVRDFFADAILPGGELDDLDLGDDYPYVLIAKSYPFGVIDSYASMGEVMAFCEETGMKYETHLYPYISQRVQ